MRDRRLEKNITRVERFIDQWKQLSHFLDRGFQGDAFTEDEEAGFLDLKSSIAQDYELLMTTLGSEAERSERALRLLNTVPSLQSIGELEEGANRRLTAEWHGTYLALQSLLGRLKGRKLQLAGQSSVRHGVSRIFTNPVVIFLVVLAAAYGVYQFSEDIAVPKLMNLMEKRQ
jgi:hypothetical protein